MTIDEDALVRELSGLAAEPPERVLDRLVARWVRVPGPVDELYVAFTDEGIAFVHTGTAAGGDDEAFRSVFEDRFGRPLRHAARPPAGLLAALRRSDGRGLRYDLRGLTPFGQQVLRTTLTVPRGEVRPYAWVAGHAGKPRAVRAAATVLARNPVPVLIPCHRVVRSDGTLGEYAFGPAVKRRLLMAEGALT